MKLLRWAVAGAASASVYAVYKYSIGKTAKGEDIFTSPEKAVAELDGAAAPEPKPAKPAKKPARGPRTRKPAAKKP